jgi:uncharacterized protein
MKMSAVAAVLTFFLSAGVTYTAWAGYSQGREAYLLKDYVKAMKEFKSDDDPRSFYQIGYMYDHGEGVPQDGKEAADWYRKAAEKGNAQAQYRMGVIYANGYGVEQDANEAVKWYRKAANQGFEPAKEALKRIQKVK